MGTIYHMGKPYLGIPDLTAEVAYVTLRASSWSNGIYTIPDARVDANSVQYISPAAGITDDQLSALQSANVQDNGQDAGHMYLKAYGTVPTVDIPIAITFTPGISTKTTDVDQAVIQNSNNPVSGGAVYDRLFPDYANATQETFDISTTLVEKTILNDSYVVINFLKSSSSNSVKFYINGVQVPAGGSIVAAYAAVTGNMICLPVKAGTKFGFNTDGSTYSVRMFIAPYAN